ncbi:MAG: glycosyltransferase [bacterium]|nr:glycosyltransferase [bacterium]
MDKASLSIDNYRKLHMGMFPPPLGGISVYLYRLSKKDKKAEFLDEKKNSGKFKFLIWFIKQCFTFKKYYYISHTISLQRRFAIYILSLIRNHKYEIVLHGRGVENKYIKSNVIIQFLIKKILGSAHMIRCVSEDLLSFLKKIGCNEDKLYVENAFLPPPEEEEDKILKTYPQEFFEFIKHKRPLIVANAFALVFTGGVDLYGLDMCLALVSKLVTKYPDTGFIFAIADAESNINYLNKIKNDLKEKGIRDNFYFLTGQRQLWPVFKRVDLMVRPTSEDGYAVSIEEALLFNCSVVASNASKRPEGTVLFENRDSNDFYNKCLNKLKTSKVRS